MMWSGVLTYQHSKYGGVNPLFGETREDDFADLTLGANYLYSDGWSLLPEITYSNNDSVLAINSYDRIRALITVRKEF